MGEGSFLGTEEEVVAYMNSLPTPPPSPSPEYTEIDLIPQEETFERRV